MQENYENQNGIGRFDIVNMQNGFKSDKKVFDINQNN